MKDANYYNKKWKRSPIIYGGRALRGRKDRINVDVKNFITTNDAILDNIVKKYRLKKSSTDATVLAVQKWVVKFLTYKSDDKENQTPEFWQFPFETLQSQIGDCEDGAILITSLCIAAGVPPFRVKVSAGYVQSAPHAETGGHAYAIYLASDSEWRIIDWCYFQDSNIKVLKKPLAKNGGQRNAYKETWFTFNNEYSWNQTSLKLGGRISNDVADLSSNTKEETLTESKTQMKDILADIDKKYKAK